VLQLNNPSPVPGFRERLRSRELLLGTFLKTPSPHATEIIGTLGFDFVVVDQEHAPFDRVSTDLILLAAKAARIAALVRVPDDRPSGILAALDDGAAGVIVPHVSSAAHARRIVSAARYHGGKRGFSNSARAGRYGALDMRDHIAVNDAATTVIAMIEDPEAVDAAAEIASVEGLDAFFLGRADLTVGLRAASTSDAPVRAAVERVAAAAGERQIPLVAYVGAIDAAEVSYLREVGVTAFAVSSEQGLMRSAASAAVSEFRALMR
jgi:staphyloferrin B biosynthesis citrate synthase